MPPSRSRFRDIVVLGASAGGTQALTELVSGFPVELPASVLVAQHQAAASPALLAGLLSRAGKLAASTAVDGEPIERGHIYVAPPDHHLLVGDGHLVVTRGPRENGHRPAVDPLFRSAARRYSRRVVAAVLSGTLDDGTAGLVAVKARGGIAVVQDPDDALHRGMPQNAIRGDHPDYVVPVSEMADLLCTLVEEPLPPEAPVGDGGRDEAPAPRWIQMGQKNDRAAAVTCPECSGPLFEHTEGGVSSFECLVGHRFSEASLDSEQARHLEAALWNAIRSLYERAELLHRLAQEHRQDSPGLARRYETRARACEEQAEAVLAAVRRLGSEPVDQLQSLTHEPITPRSSG